MACPHHRNAAAGSLCLAHVFGDANGNRMNLKGCSAADDSQMWDWWSKQ